MKINIFTKFISLLTVFAMMFNIAIADNTLTGIVQAGGFCSEGTLEELETVTVFSTGVISTSAEYPAGDYLLEANGTYEYRGSSGLLADAAFSERLPEDLEDLDLDPLNYAYDPWHKSNSYNSVTGNTGGLGIWVNGHGPVWGDTFNPDHQYFYEVEGFAGGDFEFEITDSNLNDNVGDLTVKISVCVENEVPEEPDFCSPKNLMETIEVMPTGEILYSSEYPAGDYLLEANGTYIYRNYKGQGNEFYSADSLYENLAPTDSGYGTNGNGYYTADGKTWKISGASMGIRVNNTSPRASWGTTFSPTHEYFYEVEDFSGGMFNFQITDSYYEDNEGFMTVDIWSCGETIPDTDTENEDPYISLESGLSCIETSVTEGDFDFLNGVMAWDGNNFVDADFTFSGEFRIEGDIVITYTITDDEENVIATAERTIEVKLDCDPEVDLGGDNQGDSTPQSFSSSSSSGSRVSGGGGAVLGASTEGEVLGACVPFSMYHKKGDVGGEVAKIQEFLNEHIGAGLTVDGVYGETTLKAVKDFQSKYFEQIITPWVPFFKPQPTGKFYKTTRMMANKIIDCPEAPVFLEDPKIIYEVKWEKPQSN